MATPLATLHAHNGWADQFLSTPAVGLKDTFVSVGTKLNGVKFRAIFHNYSADTGNLDFGDEINLLVAKKFNKRYLLVMKYASYSAGDLATGKVDTDKLWLMAGMKF